MNYYGTVAGYRAFHTARGRDLTGVTDDAIMVGLLLASEYIDVNFRSAFGGWKVGRRDQVREWPRYGVWDAERITIPADVIPAEIEAATYVAAAKQIAKPGVFYADFTPNKYKSVSISGAVSAEYAQGSAADFQTQMPEIAAMLASLIDGNGMSSASTSSVRC